MINNTQVIILAGGEGRRMGVDIPKVLTVLKNKPLIEYVLDSIKSCDFSKKPIVVVGYKSHLVKELLGDSVDFTNQEEQLGTGHAVLCAKDIADKDAEHTLVLYGDMPNLSKESILQLVSTQHNANSVLSMITTKVPDFLGDNLGFYGFGRILRDAAGKMKKIVELKDANEDERKIIEVNPSFFCFKTDWLWDNLSKLQNDNAQKEYYLTDLVQMAIDQGHNIDCALVNSSECIGINTPDELRRAEEIMGNK